MGRQTITLEDLALWLGLKIDGLLVIAGSTNDVRLVCQALLVGIPHDKYIKGKIIYLR